MMPRTTIPAVRLLAIVGLVTASLANGQDEEPPIRLRAASAAGDVATGEMIIAWNLNVDVNQPGRPPVSLAANASQEQKYRHEVLAAANGRPMAAKRTYSLYRLDATLPSGQAVQKRHALHGKTMSLRRTGNKVQITTAAKLTARERAGVQKSFLASETDLLPKQEVRVGQSWTLHPQRAAQVLGAQQATLKCRLAEITDYEGVKAARIELEGRMVVTTPDQPQPLRSDVSGEMYFGVDLQRLLKIELGGPVDTRERVTRNGVTVTVVTQGEFNISQTMHWIKIAGKPVNTATP